RQISTAAYPSRLFLLPSLLSLHHPRLDHQAGHRSGVRHPGERRPLDPLPCSGSPRRRRRRRLTHNRQSSTPSATIFPKMITISKEDYLKAIHEAEGEGESVISATLAHWLAVSPPAVTMALKRLRKDGLVRVRADGRVQLTPKGRQVARRTVFR